MAERRTTEVLLKIRVHAAARRRPRLLRTGGDIWYDREVVVPDGNQSTIVLDVDGQPGNRSIITLESPRRKSIEAKRRKKFTRWTGSPYYGS